VAPLTGKIMRILEIRPLIFFWAKTKVLFQNAIWFVKTALKVLVLLLIPNPDRKNRRKFVQNFPLATRAKRQQKRD